VLHRVMPHCGSGAPDQQSVEVRESALLNLFSTGT
jgi:hypothetical protein